MEKRTGEIGAVDWRVVSSERRIALGLDPNIGKAAKDDYQDKRTKASRRYQRKVKDGEIDEDE